MKKALTTGTVRGCLEPCKDCSGGFVGRLACLLSSHPAQHTTKPKKQLAKTPIDGNVSYLSIARAPPEALTAKRREQTARSGREASGDSISAPAASSSELPASCCCGCQGVLPQAQCPGVRRRRRERRRPAQRAGGHHRGFGGGLRVVDPFRNSVSLCLRELPAERGGPCMR